MARSAGTGAVAYLRVSSSGQVQRDGFPRQREAVRRFASKAGLELVGEFRDEGVSGTCGLADRPGLSKLVERVAGNGVRVVVVEKADRLARDLIEGELILRELRKLGVRVIEAEGGNDVTEGDPTNPTAKLIRQVLGAVAEFEKDALVAKLRAARVRRRRATGRCEGVKPFGVLPGEAETLSVVRRAHRRNPHTGRRRSYREIADTLNGRGLASRSGKAWTAPMVRNLLRSDKRGRSR